MFNQIIKWKKLSKIVKSLTKKEITIILTTGINNPEIIAATDHVENIFLNGNTVKSLDMVIAALSHEVVHILDKNIKENSKPFIKKMENIKKYIKSKY